MRKIGCKGRKALKRYYGKLITFRKRGRTSVTCTEYSNFSVYEFFSSWVELVKRNGELPHPEVPKEGDFVIDGSGNIDILKDLDSDDPDKWRAMVSAVASVL